MSIALLQLKEEKAPATSKLFRILPIQVIFHFKMSLLATLQFKESRKKKRENIYMAVKK